MFIINLLAFVYCNYVCVSYSRYVMGLIFVGWQGQRKERARLNKTALRCVCTWVCACVCVQVCTAALSGWLCVHCMVYVQNADEDGPPKTKKKRVSWAPEDSLIEVQYFEVDESERGVYCGICVWVCLRTCICIWGRTVGRERISKDFRYCTSFRNRGMVYFVLLLVYHCCRYTSKNTPFLWKRFCYASF